MDEKTSKGELRLIPPEESIANADRIAEAFRAAADDVMTALDRIDTSVTVQRAIQPMPGESFTNVTMVLSRSYKCSSCDELHHVRFPMPVESECLRRFETKELREILTGVVRLGLACVDHCYRVVSDEAELTSAGWKVLR